MRTWSVRDDDDNDDGDDDVGEGFGEPDKDKWLEQDKQAK